LNTTFSREHSEIAPPSLKGDDFGKILTKMDSRPIGAAHVWIVKLLGLFIICTILIAGLWPFHSTKNEVDWLENENGIRFGHHGSIVSSGAFRANVSKEDTSSSIEISLKPEQINGTNTILTFEGSGSPRVSFGLQQYLSGLVALHNGVHREGSTRDATFGVKGVFRHGEPVFVTLTSGSQNTFLYVNGVPTDVSRTFRLSSKDLSGQLVLANSTRNNSWAGQFLGLAIYHQQLTPAQVTAHYATWARNQWPTVAGRDEGLWARYLFNERKGNRVHDQLGNAPDLVIPEHFVVLHPPFFQFPWHEYRASWSYWKDVGINIIGFIPLGFVFVAYFSSVRGVHWPLATTIVTGFCLSLAIEALQAFLPTRSSSMTDVITNTLGTIIGALAWRCSIVQKFLIALGCYGVSCPADFGLVLKRNSSAHH
jgi:hypothetical protein